jgi:hypothetical protein
MPSGSSLLSLGAALYKLVSSDAVIQNITPRVYDTYAPVDALYPYAVIGEWTEVPDDILTRQGRQATVAIHVFSRYQGSAEVKRIVDRLTQIIARASFTVAGWNAISAELESTLTLLEPGPTQHAICRFRWRLSPK